MFHTCMISFLAGVLTSSSLPAGAMVAVFSKPTRKFTGILTAFGAGALICAVTIGIVAQRIDSGNFITLSLGCLSGGILFVLINGLINAKGGFLRKRATSVYYISQKKKKKLIKIFNALGNVRLFRNIPPSDLSLFLPYIYESSFKKGEKIITQGEKGKSLYIIKSGVVDVIDEISGNHIITLKKNEVVGEISLITNKIRTATVICKEDAEFYLIDKKDLDHVLEKSNKMSLQFSNIIKQRIKDLHKREFINNKIADSWQLNVQDYFDSQSLDATKEDIKKEASLHNNAPIAIFVGVMLDGIPESLVIGAGMAASKISISFLVGLFISNFPESFSSAAGMKEQKYSKSFIFFMWFSIMIMSGIFAVIGNFFLNNASHSVFILFEGVAVGAMIAMIAETMLPEAYEKGGSLTGLSTLIGFLTSLYFYTLD